MSVLYVASVTVAAVAALYFLAIMPRPGRRKERKEFLGVYYAHRGLHDNTSEAPENSMAAFRKEIGRASCRERV